MRKMFFMVSLLLINISAWGQTAASFSVDRVAFASSTLTDRNWVSEIAKFMSALNELAAISKTGVITYEINRLNSLEEQLLQKANAALSNETIRRGETWLVGLEQRPMENAPRGTRSYTFFFHCDSNGELYFLLYRFEKLL